MNEAEIRQAAEMYALVAKMHAMNARIEGMKTANISEVASSGLPMYNEQAFISMHDELYIVAAKLKEEI